MGEADLASNTKFTSEGEPKLVRPIWQVGWGGLTEAGEVELKMGLVN